MAGLPLRCSAVIRAGVKAVARRVDDEAERLNRLVRSGEGRVGGVGALEAPCSASRHGRKGRIGYNAA